MGGAAGHLQHVFEDLDLSFHDIKTIFSKAASGDLEKVSEKLDGINLMFSWSVTLDELRVARNASNIKSGGLGEAEIADMFKDRGNLTEAFKQAFSVLNKAFSAIPLSNKKRYFGDAQVWYSIEIIYTKNPNVILYDNNALVFHSWPVLSVLNGEIVKNDTQLFVDEIDKHISNMQKAVNRKDWNILGPVLVKMKNLSLGGAADAAVSKLTKIVSSAGLNDSNTLRDFIRSSLEEEARKQKINNDILDKVVDRCLSVPRTPTLTNLKQLLKNNTAQLEIVTSFVKNNITMQKKIMQPIEKLIQDFAVQILDNVKSTLIQNNDSEILRLRQEVAKTIAAIKGSNDESMMSTMQQHLMKLDAVENITSPVEGVVFMYKGNAYKFTGAFAPANQLLGLFRYGKKCNKMNRSIY